MSLVKRHSRCVCGSVELEALGEPILSGVCYCDDCQAGGQQIEALPDAAPVLDADGGTQYLTYRDDRLACTKGAELLKGYKLGARAPTTRFVASCCNSAMYLKFRPGHWVSTYRNRFDGDVPALEMRNQTRFRTANTPVPDDAPSFRRYPIRLFAKLIQARIAMWTGR